MKVHPKMAVSKTMKKTSSTFTKYNAANIDLEMFELLIILGSKEKSRGFTLGPVVRTPPFQFKSCGLDPWLGN